MPRSQQKALTVVFQLHYIPGDLKIVNRLRELQQYNLIVSVQRNLPSTPPQTEYTPLPSSYTCMHTFRNVQRPQMTTASQRDGKLTSHGSATELRPLPTIASPNFKHWFTTSVLPSTTAVFSYATGSRKLSANEQFFCWRSNSSKFVTINSDKTTRVIYNRQRSLHQHK